ncbi:MAG: short-chain dehydrogenase, partial [Chloroflexi bacterium]|nr:short-chain dehydrogenase [Chloroflexota bacterium]
MAVLDKLKLDGKIAVVTGAGRGLGRAMALALAE